MRPEGEGQGSLFGPSADAAPGDARAASPAAEPAPAGSTPATAVPVSAVNASVRGLLEARFRPLWIAGEVGNWRRAASGHCWFTLRDGSAQLSCVMFRLDAARLPAEPEEGMEVCAFGQLTVYEARGTFQLVVRSLEGRGEGLWRLAFERLRARLAVEGLLDPARKRRLPRVPRCVGVVTSRDGAALRDVITVLRRRAPWIRLLLSGCRVQGEGAAREIAAALERLVRDGTPDVIILTRGGGSVEDLWPFNEEIVARAIAASPVPTVSAVGHEVDVTIADLVADVRAATPSAAAELVAPDAAELRGQLRGLAGGLVRGLRRCARRSEERAVRAAGRLVAAARRRVERREARVAVAAGRLEALSPLRTLARGYAVPLGPGGAVLRRTRAFAPGSEYDLRVVDGVVRSRALEVSPVAEGE